MLLSLLLCLAILGSASIYQSPDSLAYAATIRDGGSRLFHPHHLLFAPVNRAAYLVLHEMGIPSDPVAVARVHNVFWLFVALCSIAGIGIREKWGRRAQLYALVMFALLNGMLEFATQVEVYIPAMAACLAAVALAWRRERYSRGRMLLISVFCTLAVLYHQVMIFPLMLGLFVLLSHGRDRLSLLGAAAFVGIVVLGAYIVGYRHESQHDGAAGFLTYASGYLTHPAPDWGTMRNYSLDGLRQLLSGHVQMVMAAGRSLAVVAGLLLSVGVIFLVVWLWQSRRRTDLPHAGIRVLALWYFSLELFFLWWFPFEREFHLLSLPPLFLLVLLFLRDLLRRQRPRTAFPSAARQLILAAALGTIIVLGWRNLPGVHARSQSRGDWYERAIRMEQHMSGIDRYYSDSQSIAVFRYAAGRKDDHQIEVIQLLFDQDRFDRYPFLHVQPGSYAIALSDILPSYWMERDASDKPAVRRYLFWLFDIREAPGSGYTYRRYRLGSAAAGEQFLLFDSLRDSAATAAVLLAPLAATAAHPVLLRHLQP